MKSVIPIPPLSHEMKQDDQPWCSGAVPPPIKKGKFPNLRAEHDLLSALPKVVPLPFYQPLGQEEGETLDVGVEASNYCRCWGPFWVD